MSSSYETILEVDLRKLESNFNFLSSKLKDNCKIIVFVKLLDMDMEMLKFLKNWSN